MLDDRSPCQYAIGVAKQIFQQRVFFVRQRDLLACPPDSMGEGFDFELRDDERHMAFRLTTRPAKPLVLAQMGPETGPYQPLLDGLRAPAP